MNIAVNYLGVLLAAVAAMLVGMAWYSKPLFLGEFMRLSGKKPEDMNKKEGMGKTMTIAFVAQLLTAYVLAHFIVLLNISDVSGAMQLAFWAWLGFTATVEVGSVLWEGKPWKLFAINAGQTLVAMLVMAVVLILV